MATPISIVADVLKPEGKVQATANDARVGATRLREWPLEFEPPGASSVENLAGIVLRGGKAYADSRSRIDKGNSGCKRYDRSQGGSMKGATRFMLLILTLVLGTSPEALALANQEDPSPANIGCDSKLEVACQQLREGVKAYRSANFADAIYHFRNAADLDPGFVQAKLYLAKAREQQYVPGGESPDNLRIANQAIEAFEAVLKLDPKNDTGLASIAKLYYNQKQFGKAKQYELRRIEVAPANPEPYYWVGVLDWAMCFPRTQTLRMDLQLDTPLDPDNPTTLPPLPNGARDQLASENAAAVEEGLQNLKKAIELRPDDADAMAYLNLLYRQKAELEASDESRGEDLRIAEEWVNKALEKRRARNPHPPPMESPQH